MGAFLEHWDHQLFFLINSGLHCTALNWFCMALSELGRWAIALVAVAVLLPGGWRALRRHLLILVVFVAIASGLNSAIKEVVYRARPGREFKHEIKSGEVTVYQLEEVKRRSFPSGHSLLAFVLMTYVGQVHRRFRPYGLTLAFLIAFSRVYVGAHFPFDCLAGAVGGAFWGLLAWKTWQRMERGEWPFRHQKPATAATGGGSGSCSPP